MLDLRSNIVLMFSILAASVSTPIYGQWQRDGWAERVVVIVPITGNGTYEDPRRPDLGELQTKGADPMSYRWEPSDDGKFAIVLLSSSKTGAARTTATQAKSKAQLQGLSPSLDEVFERGKHSKAEIETAIKHIKKDFTMESLAGVPPVVGQEVKK